MAKLVNCHLQRKLTKTHSKELYVSKQHSDPLEHHIVVHVLDPQKERDFLSLQHLIILGLVF